MRSRTAHAMLGISHTPLLGQVPLEAAVREPLQAALDEAARLVRGFAPDLLILVGPDHYNGFFNELMPTFCLGTHCTAVGDYETLAGELSVDEGKALELADHLMASGFDLAVSRRMRVDHGFAQPISVIWRDLASAPPAIPIFMNAVAPPTVPTILRCHEFGRALGRYLEGLQGRTLLIASGGLSHEPPVPTFQHPDPAVRERIMRHQPLTAEEQQAKLRRVIAAADSFARGEGNLKPLNPEWDLRWMDAIAAADFDAILSVREDAIAAVAGTSAHESKTWLIARSAISANASVKHRYYAAIPALIAGFGVMYID